MTERYSEERLLELLGENSPESRAELQRLREEAGATGELAQLEEFLLRSRQAALSSQRLSRRREKALVTRILNRTTREDLSWRGDLSLMRGFLGDRARESALVRLVAASLLFHLLVGPPVLAWVLLRSPDSQPEIFFHLESREESDLAPEEQEDPAVAADPEVDPEVLAARAAQNLVRRARYLLDPRHAELPLAVGEVARPEDALALRLLDARSRWLHAGEWPRWLDAESALGAGGGPDLALLVELLLDRYVVAGDRAALFHGALERLQGLEQPGDLERAALSRARSYGLLEGSLEWARKDPIDRAWRDLLEASLGELAGDARAISWTSGS